jgi:hypothetical protein
MRGTIAKRIRRAARAAAANTPTKTTIISTIKRYFTGKVDAKGQRVVDEVNKETVRYSGYRRVYQDMKREYLNG